MTFAPEGSAAFQEEFGKAMVDLAEATKKAVGTNLVTLVLSGGFGRGEGGIVRTDKGDHAYNDVDLFLFVKDATVVDRSKLHAIEESFSERLRAEVEFGPPTTLHALSLVRPAQIWYDLIHGHRVLAGDPGFTNSFTPSVRNQVPAYEGSRLLLNRGAGLLWVRLAAGGHCAMPDPEFVRRNIWKANLALRDGALIIDGAYTPDWRSRIDAYKAWFGRTKPNAKLLQIEAIERAAEFKTAPYRFPQIENADALVAEWVEAFLEMESMRLGQSFPDPSAYQAYSGLRETAVDSKDWLRNLAQNVKSGSFSTIGRRNRLYPELPSLLVQKQDAEWKTKAEHWMSRWKAWC